MPLWPLWPPWPPWPWLLKIGPIGGFLGIRFRNRLRAWAETTSGSNRITTTARAAQHPAFKRNDGVDIKTPRKGITITSPPGSNRFPVLPWHQTLPRPPMGNASEAPGNFSGAPNDFPGGLRIIVECPTLDVKRGT